MFYVWQLLLVFKYYFSFDKLIFAGGAVLLEFVIMFLNNFCGQMVKDSGEAVYNTMWVPIFTYETFLRITALEKKPNWYDGLYSNVSIYVTDMCTIFVKSLLYIPSATSFMAHTLNLNNFFINRPNIFNYLSEARRISVLDYDN